MDLCHLEAGSSLTSMLVAVRSAVRTYLEELEAGDTVLVACSGGADSLALAYALAAEGKKLALRLVGVTVDHQLQDGSAAQAEKVSQQLLTMGYDDVVIETVVVTPGSNREAHARDARYAALDACVQKLQAAQIYLGHTRDDQAETVLLGLARGSGTRSLSGMAIRSGKYIRPLLAISREETVAACKEAGLDFWLDPHNNDTSYTRVRVRKEVMPLLEEKLGPGISAALARSAQLLRDDADALDEMARDIAQAIDIYDVAALSELPRAIRTRILRTLIYSAGAPSGSLSADHIAAVEALITSWHGQGEVSLPANVKVSRISGRLSLS